MYQKTYTGYDKEEKGRKGIKLKIEPYLKWFNIDKIKIMCNMGIAILHRNENKYTQQKWKKNNPAADKPSKGSGQLISAQAIDQESNQGKDRDQPCHLQYIIHNYPKPLKGLLKITTGHILFYYRLLNIY